LSNWMVAAEAPVTKKATKEKSANGR